MSRMTEEEWKAWEGRVREARRRSRVLRDYVSHPDPPHDVRQGERELKEEELYLAANRELVALRKVMEAAKYMHRMAIRERLTCRSGIMVGPYNDHSKHCRECDAWRFLDAALNAAKEE